MLLVTAVWFLARTRLIPRTTVDRTDELAGHFVAMLALLVVAAVVAADNAYSLLLLLPSLHVWLFAPNFRGRSAAARAVVFGLGLVGPGLLVASFAVRLGIGLDGPWYVGTLFSVGYASVVLFVAFLAWAAASGQIGAMLFGRYAPYPAGALESEPHDEGGSMY